MRMRIVTGVVMAAVIGLSNPNVAAALASADEPATQKPPAPPPAPPPTGPPPGADAPPPPPSAPTRDGRARKTGPNVRVEVTFTEQRSDAPTQPKTVTVTTSDGHWGRVRAQAHSTGVGGSPLNVDARPELQPDGRLLLALTLEYGDKRVSQSPETSGDKTVPQPVGTPVVLQNHVTDVTINQSVTVILDSGKPLVVSQAADPMSDRKVTVEVKATILR